MAALRWHFLALSMLTPCSIAPLVAQAKATAYVKDTAYLLDEFEKGAGTLLKQKGVDWKAVRAEFTKLAREVKDDVAHVKLCTRLIARLNDGHAGFTKVDVKMPEEPRTVSCGITLCEQDKTVLVKTASAAAGGLSSGTVVLEIAGKNASEWLAEQAKRLCENHGFSTEHAARYAACHWAPAGPEGTKLELLVADPAGARRKVTLLADKKAGDARYVGPLFPSPKLQRLGRRDAYGLLESGYGYIYLGECATDLPAELDQALAKLADAPGLILDVRANNGGGTDHEAVFGRFLAAGAKWRQYSGQGKANFVGPMVVIVDAGTRSAGETVGGQFKEDGRGYLIGPEPSAGMSAQKQEIEVPSKLFKVRFATHSNKLRFQGGKGIEGVGILPHEIVPWDPALMQQGIDPMIRRAEELLKSGFPKGTVAYAPPQAAKR